MPGLLARAATGFGQGEKGGTNEQRLRLANPQDIWPLSFVLNDDLAQSIATACAAQQPNQELAIADLQSPGDTAPWSSLAARTGQRNLIEK